MVVFGASGDLASRKLLPAIAALAEHGALPEGFTVVGVARTAWSDDQFRQAAIAAAPFAGTAWHDVVKRFRYVAGEYAEKPTFDKLKKVLTEADQKFGTAGNRVYYLATIPSMFGAVATALAEHGCNAPGQGGTFARIVVEKPFGRDLQSARGLDAAMHAAFDEDQIFRIDHYLGKETVQNVLALRFGNAIFEPIWNRRYVDHIQITVAEELGVEHRGGFYETAGALRDIVQNHVMQVLALTLMEPPATVDSQGIRDEKVKLLRAVVVPDVGEAVINSVRGQYGAGTINGDPVVGYRQEPGVDAHSRTETFVALRLTVDNWRWAGVPVYIRTGKRLPKRATGVVLQFQRVPHLAFGSRLTRDLRPNMLQLRIQPDEGICLLFGAKVPGEAFRLRSVDMEFNYADAFPGTTAEGYERLLHDVMIGDATLFIRTDEVERAWQIVDPLLEAWSEDGVPLSLYPAGTWGPKEADALLARDLRQWHQP
jgi:glucose-6-phosphate 1-dehydrogenase